VDIHDEMNADEEHPDKEARAAELAKRLFALPPKPRKDTKSAARKPKAAKGK
jgi:hypothetical protein